MKAIDRRARSNGKEPRSREKHGLILRAAIRVFSRRGFFNSKVSDIAREAGVADGTVYLYFKNKDHILVSIFDVTMTEAIADGRKALEALDDPRRKLERIAGLHLERMGRDRDLAVVFQVELRSSTKFMEQFSETGVTEYLDLIRSVVREGQQQGIFREALDATLVSKVFFGALDEMVTNWVLSRKRYDLRATAGPVLDLFFNGMKT
jgi:TetR/AcrR family fatty acid metabolism transcriptional regulator